MNLGIDAELLQADAKTMNVLLAEIRISCNLYEISLILTDMLLRKLLENDNHMH